MFEKGNPIKYTDPTGHLPQNALKDAWESFKWDPGGSVDKTQEAMSKSKEVQVVKEVYHRTPVLPDTVNILMWAVDESWGIDGVWINQDRLNQRRAAAAWSGVSLLSDTIPGVNSGMRLMQGSSSAYNLATGNNFYQDAANSYVNFLNNAGNYISNWINRNPTRTGELQGSLNRFERGVRYGYIPSDSSDNTIIVGDNGGLVSISPGLEEKMRKEGLI